MPEQTYIAIKNWEKYQMDNKGIVREGPSDWIKDWTDKEADYEYSKLTCLQRYIYDGLRRLRGKFGKNPHNDPTYIGRALDVLSKERKHIPQAIQKLAALGLVAICETASYEYSGVPVDGGCKAAAGSVQGAYPPVTPLESTKPVHRIEKSRVEKSRKNSSSTPERQQDKTPTPSAPCSHNYTPVFDGEKQRCTECGDLQTLCPGCSRAIGVTEVEITRRYPEVSAL